jgi:hypothetical protein
MVRGKCVTPYISTSLSEHINYFMLLSLDPQLICYRLSIISRYNWIGRRPPILRVNVHQLYTQSPERGMRREEVLPCLSFYMVKLWYKLINDLPPLCPILQVASKKDLRSSEVHSRSTRGGPTILSYIIITQGFAVKSYSNEQRQ